MLSLPESRDNPLLMAMRRASEASACRRAASIADHLAAMHARQARRQNLYARIGTSKAVPVRWHRAEPRDSNQYAGHLATTAMRDRRLTPQAKALLVVLRARCGNGVRTETCKTTLAHIMGVCTRSIGRYLADLVRFGYIEAVPRIGRGGLFTGLVVSITDKVLPCFRKLSWLAGWLAHNLQAQHGGNLDRTELSYKNHSYKEYSFLRASPPDP